MELHVEEIDFVRELRTRRDAEGGLFWLRDGELAVLDADAAQQANALNFADLTLNDRFVDLIRGRKSPNVSWKQVRASWGPMLAQLNRPAALEALAQRLEDGLGAHLGQSTDLVRLFQEVCTQALVPLVLTELSTADRASLERDQTFKLDRLLSLEADDPSWLETVRTSWIQIRAGLVARRELRGRARGRRARSPDLTDSLVEMLPTLGMDRAVDAVTAILTAIAGPPGAAAVCLVLELLRQEAWAQRLEEELRALPRAALAEAPSRAAPLAQRFVKEVLRRWSPPIVLTRSVRVPMRLGAFELAVGQFFHVSTYLLHNDPRYWPEPERFEPDRWLPGSPLAARVSSAYVPFGWAPTACLGAGPGTFQLLALAHLLSTRFRVELDQPERVTVTLASVAAPQGFRGRLLRR